MSSYILLRSFPIFKEQSNYNFLPISPHLQAFSSCVVQSHPKTDQFNSNSCPINLNFYGGFDTSYFKQLLKAEVYGKLLPGYMNYFFLYSGTIE